LVLAFILFGNGNQLLIVSLFTIRLFGLFLLEQAKAEVRGKHDNKKFGQIEIYSNIGSIEFFTAGVNPAVFLYFAAKNRYNILRVKDR
jgi:hypothetical protein